MVVTGHRDKAPQAIQSLEGGTLPGLRRMPVWPLYALFLGYPLWWALGLTSVIWVLAAFPMAIALARRGRIRVPRGFGLWLLFLLWVLVGVTALGMVAPDTMPDSGGLMGYSHRLLLYLAATVMLLYVGNLTEQEMPQLTVAKLLGFLGVVTVVGGLAGVTVPTLEFTSALEMLLPQRLTGDKWIEEMVHPAVAQLHQVIGSAPEPRPKAPFEYTNTWGNNLSVLLIWAVAAWWAHGSRGRRWLTALLLAVAMVPIVYSLNRGVWVGLIIAVLYVAVRLVLRGRIVVIGALMVAALLAIPAFAVTPLGSLVQARLQNGHSDSIRTTLALKSVEAARSSPIIGYGTGRAMRGSASSIAVGRSPSCRQCGNAQIGSTGQLWLVLISHGLVGTVLYFGFFVHAMWRYRRDDSAIGIAGSLVVLLSFWYATTYPSAGSPLCLTFIAIALLWRNDLARRERMAAERAEWWLRFKRARAEHSRGLRPVKPPAGPARPTGPTGLAKSARAARSKGIGTAVPTVEDRETRVSVR
ncbi:O-antigen ligase family protein [Thermomonospora amylolytica]|uniref:O-antigen ligase family protein n=1 Tax=Thermomonospora amylolytica TaxID=1411117 RepID=UPI0013009CEB|nr:O-antigen ligase family protein [Thermomonospora amylolytica]